MPYVTNKSLRDAEPAKSQELWRYLDFPKFAALIQDQILFFPSLMYLEDDPWEGLPSIMNFRPDAPVVLRKNQVTENGEIIEEVQHMEAGALFGDQHASVVKEFKEAAIKFRKCCSVNCWHMNDSESDSQWRIYGNASSSLAIVSSFEQVCDSIEDQNEIFGSRVFYFNPKRDTTPAENAFFPVIHKRQAFAHEREFRLIHCDYTLLKESKIPKGKRISVNLQKLISRIVISPRAPSWFVKVVENFLRQNNLISIPVDQSDLLDLSSFLIEPDQVPGLRT